jgi:hypothetical protein
VVFLLLAAACFFVRKRSSGQNEAICHILIFCYNEMHTPVTYISDGIRIDVLVSIHFYLQGEVCVPSVAYSLKWCCSGIT